ncbi:hypothetical protein KC19_6G194300 [Ceratodon purpureus]|uniref:Uncharacterized protein n=1 Tax=Ceratodon purpureus TaxID=3225 RepID=A0A8T0HJB0_CERPU|nr:hypothetical protein KC19_6G194300 [Ceratodon purpureus]
MPTPNPHNSLPTLITPSKNGHSFQDGNARGTTHAQSRQNESKKETTTNALSQGTRSKENERSAPFLNPVAILSHSRKRTTVAGSREEDEVGIPLLTISHILISSTHFENHQSIT